MTKKPKPKPTARQQLKILAAKHERLASELRTLTAIHGELLRLVESRGKKYERNIARLTAENEALHTKLAAK